VAENKTKPTNVDVETFLDSVSAQRQRESRQLIAIMQGISDRSAVMWGPSIIGFGSYHYKYASGREGDMPVIGFSPRKASLTIYIYSGLDDYGDLLEALGKHKTSASCLYINKLDDVDLGALEKIIRRSCETITSGKWPDAA